MDATITHYTGRDYDVEDSYVERTWAKRPTFKASSNEDVSAPHDGKPFTITRIITEADADFDQECLPMAEIAFADCPVFHAFMDECFEDNEEESR